MKTSTSKSVAARLASLSVAVAATIYCSSNSPSAPSGVAVSSVTLSAANIAIGSTSIGTITLSGSAPTGGASIALTSSNPAVATVQTSVTIAAGQSSGTMIVTAVSAGTAIVAASFNGSIRQSPIITVTQRSGLFVTSLSLAASTVVGGNPVMAMVTLNDNAPAGGAVVSLSGGEPVSVPASVTVPSGSSNARFAVTTRAVGGVTPATIQASFGGASAVATLSVTPPTVATARFGVTGPTESDTCTLTSDGNNTLNCTFNATTSTAPGTITAYDWTYGVATMVAQTTTGPVLTNPTVSCSLIPPPPLPAGTQWFTMTVTLTIHDNQGNVSDKTVNSGVRLIPKSACGF